MTRYKAFSSLGALKFLALQRR